jgi:exonuclease I
LILGLITPDNPADAAMDLIAPIGMAKNVVKHSPKMLKMLEELRGRNAALKKYKENELKDRATEIVEKVVGRKKKKLGIKDPSYTYNPETDAMLKENALMYSTDPESLAEMSNDEIAAVAMELLRQNSQDLQHFRLSEGARNLSDELSRRKFGESDIPDLRILE